MVPSPILLRGVAVVAQACKRCAGRADSLVVTFRGRQPAESSERFGGPAKMYEDITYDCSATYSMPYKITFILYVAVVATVSMHTISPKYPVCIL